MNGRQVAAKVTIAEVRRLLEKISPGLFDTTDPRDEIGLRIAQVEQIKATIVTTALLQVGAGSDPLDRVRKARATMLAALDVIEDAVRKGVEP